jgi:hypothetical protein
MNTVKAETTTIPMPFPDDHAEKSAVTATKLRSGL